MKDIEILEINEVHDHEEGLSLLLEDSVNNGAFDRFLSSYRKERSLKLLA